MDVMHGVGNIKFDISIGKCILGLYKYMYYIQSLMSWSTVYTRYL